MKMYLSDLSKIKKSGFFFKNMSKDISLVPSKSLWNWDSSTNWMTTRSKQQENVRSQGKLQIYPCFNVSTFNYKNL